MLQVAADHAEPDLVASGKGNLIRSVLEKQGCGANVQSDLGLLVVVHMLPA